MNLAAAAYTALPEPHESTARSDIAVFCMPLRGHFNRLSPIVAGLARLGRHVDVYTHRAFEAEVCRYGAHFQDLFSDLTVEEVDATSIPTSSRYVSFEIGRAHV